MKSESILSFSILHGNSRLEAATMSWLTSLGRMSEEKKRKLLQHATFHHCQCGSWGLVSTLCNSHTCHSRWQKNKNVPTQVVLSKHGSANAFTSFFTPYCENGGKRRNRQKKKRRKKGDLTVLQVPCVAGQLWNKQYHLARWTPIVHWAISYTSAVLEVDILCLLKQRGSG